MHSENNDRLLLLYDIHVVTDWLSLDLHNELVFKVLFTQSPLYNHNTLSFQRNSWFIYS